MGQSNAKGATREDVPMLQDPLVRGHEYHWNSCRPQEPINCVSEIIVTRSRSRISKVAVLIGLSTG